MPEIFAATLIFAIVVFLVFSVVDRRRDYKEFKKASDEVLALQRRLDDLKKERAMLEAQYASVRRERERLRF